MKDATLDLYKAVRAKLTADTAVAADVGSRVLADWGATSAHPCIRLHIPESRKWEADCGDGAEHRVHVHIYTAESGPVAVSRIAANVRAALEDAALTLDDANLWWITYEATISRRDPDDPLLQTARVEFTAVTTDKP